MTTDSIREKIQEIIRQQKGKEIDLSSNGLILEQMAEDSVEIMEFVLTIEDEFQIEISDDLIESFHTLEDVIKYIEKQVNVR